MRLCDSIERCVDRLTVYLYGHLKKMEQREIMSRNSELLSKFKSCGTGVGMWGRVYISGAEQIEIGNNVHIGNNAFIRAEGGLSIGDNTHISRNLVLYTINHRYEGDRIPYDDQIVKKPVRIGKNVWIGMNVCIAPGSTIGDGAVVGMGTVVSGDVPPLTIIGNSKWRVLGHRNVEHYMTCEQEARYGGPNGYPL